MNTPENAAFEYAAKHFLALAKEGDKYQDGYTQTCWDLWQARALLHGEAAADVFAERLRQISGEGWTPEHDDEHGNGELARAAATYALHAIGVPGALQVHTIGGALWPWDFSWLKPADNRRNLVKAGALILAEIERLDRQQQNT